MKDITPNSTLIRRLNHGKICRAVMLEAADRIEELEEKLELWCEYYVNGLPPDEVHDLYIDTVRSVVG
jgi:hypothetical protein